MSENMPQTMSIKVKRIFNAPIETMWQIWTEPEHIMKWWGPNDFTSPSCSIDLKVGGRLLFCMRAPGYMGGQDSFTVGKITLIEIYKRLEFTQSLSDKDGNVIDPATIGLPDFPREVHNVVEFKKLTEDFTEITITGSGYGPNQTMAFAYTGWQQSMDKLAESVAKK